MQSVNEIVKAFNKLPKGEREKVLEILVEGEQQDKPEIEKLRAYQIERYKKARKWLDENSEKYMNQWVCLEGDRLIGHGNDALELHQKAKDLGIEIPFVHHIVPEVDMGGW